MAKVDICKDALDPHTQVFLRGRLIPNADGTFSIQNDDNTYGGQMPGLYGQFQRSPAIGPWEKFTLDGMVATYWPVATAPVYSYVMRHLPNW